MYTDCFTEPGAIEFLIYDNEFSNKLPDRKSTKKYFCLRLYDRLESFCPHANYKKQFKKSL